MNVCVCYDVVSGLSGIRHHHLHLCVFLLKAERPDMFLVMGCGGVGVRFTIIYDNVLDQPCVVSLEGTITPAYSLHIIIISLTPTPTPRRRYHCPQPDKKDPPRAEDQKKLMLGGVSYNLYIQLLGNISSRKVQ